MVFIPETGIVETPFAKIAPIIEDGTIQQLIKKSLQQAMLFGIEFEEKEKWPANLGQTLTFPREAPLPLVLAPHNPNQDPTYQVPKYEETMATIAPYRGAERVNMLEAEATVRGETASKTNRLVVQAAQSVNAARRRALYSGYLGGHAVALTTEGVATTTLQVNSINGFRRQLDADGKWLAVSGDNPKPIQIGPGTFRKVIGVSALSSAFPGGRGTLTLDAAATWTINDPVVAMDAPHRIYQGGLATTNDGITTSSLLSFDSLRRAIALLDENAVPRHSDGTYWVHLGPRGKPQLWADPEFQNVLRGGVETMVFGNYTLYRAMSCTFIENNQVPTRSNLGALQNSRISTTNAKLGLGIDSEIVNRNGIELGHTIITGGGLGKTWWFDQQNIRSAAGMNAVELYGMTVTADNMTIVAEELIRFLMAAPTDDMRQFMPMNWQFIGSFMLWNDAYGGTYSEINDKDTTRNPYYKRAVVITHYAG